MRKKGTGLFLDCRCCVINKSVPFLLEVGQVMNERQKLLCAQLAEMGSEQAAEWLMTKYPVESIGYGEALLLIPHRSWKRSDQKRLAQYYFRKLPFSGARGYEAFASFMIRKRGQIYF